MPASTSGAEQYPRLRDRLAATRRARFVGRQPECELFSTALTSAEPPFAVLHVYGPGGIGKTALLTEYARIAADAGAVVVRLDGRDVDPSPTGFLQAFGLALGLADDVSSLEALSSANRAVVLVDTYEALTPLDAWLRESFLPQLPMQSLVVIAGRIEPVAAWRTDPDWSDIARIVSLRNLPPDDCRTYLFARGIPDSQHQTVLALTHGHPLALGLVADLMARIEQEVFRLEQAPDIVRTLLERFVQHVPSADHRIALEICARTRVTTEALLSEVLGGEAAPALFQWLRGLSFVEHSAEGLFPHDLARDVLDTDLRWRNPDGFRELHLRVLHYLVRRLQGDSGREQQRAYFDLVFLSRNSPVMRPYYDWKAMGSTYAEPATQLDFPGILDMVRRHEGEESVRITAYWRDTRPDAFIAFRSAEQRLAGFTIALLLDEVSEEDRDADPAMAAAWRVIRRSGPLRPGERLIHQRSWMSRDTYQDLPASNLVAAVAGVRWLTTPGLAWTFAAVSDPEFWEPHFAAINFPRALEADFAVGGRRFGVFAHDWRVEPPLLWIERKGQLEFTDAAGARIEPRTESPLIVLSHPDFINAVRRALREFTRPDALAANPLLRSRVAAEFDSVPPSPATLRAILAAAAESLRANPGDEKLYRALQRTYFQPAVNQEVTAELLGLPFSTYRHHLSRGIDRVTEWLWQRELHRPAS